MRTRFVLQNILKLTVRYLLVTLLFVSVTKVSGQNYFFYNATTQTFSITLRDMDYGLNQQFTIVPGYNTLGPIDVGTSYRFIMPYMPDVVSGTRSFYWGCVILSGSEWLIYGNEMHLDDYYFPDPDACNYLITLGIAPNNAPPPPPPPTGFELSVYNGTQGVFDIRMESTAFTDEEPYKRYTINLGVNSLDHIEEGQFKLILPYREDIASGATKIIWNCTEVSLSELTVKNWGIWIDKAITDENCQHTISFIPDPVTSFSISLENNTSITFPLKLKKSTGEEYTADIVPGQNSIGPINSGKYELSCGMSELLYGLVTLDWNGIEVLPGDWIVGEDNIKLKSRHISGSGVVHTLRFNPINVNGVTSFQLPDPTHHYTQITTYRQAMSQIPTNLSPQQAMRNVTYYDGFGRSKQLVQSAGNPYKRDIVVPVSYDETGNETKKYMPYVGRGESSDFRPNALLDQKNFYKYPLNRIAQTDAAYAKSELDDSPMNRIKEQGSVGTPWQPNGTVGKTTKFEILYNTAYSTSGSHRAVRRFWVDPANHALKDRTSTGDIVYYAPNEIVLSVIKNVHWTEQDGQLNTTEMYTDKAGKKLLQRSFDRDDNDDVIVLSTYYVYNDLDELCYILPPVLDPDAATVVQADVDKYGIQFRYDHKGRKIEEKQPGIDSHYFVYDIHDQLVAVQSPNQRADNTWSFIKYDHAGRMVMEGLVSYTGSVTALRQMIVNLTDTYESSSLSSSTGYTDNAWPSTGVLHYNAFYYYDNYDRISDFPTRLQYNVTPGVDKVDFPTGLPTVTKSYTDTGAELWSVNYYDPRGDLIQTQATNHLGGRNIVNNVYNFTGELTETERKHYDSSDVLQLTVRNTHSYDHAGRLLHVKQQINSQAEVTLAAYAYNEIGQVVDKKLHKLAGQTKYLQSIDFRYNERGWLRSINDPDLQTTSLMNDGDVDSAPDLFGMQLSYNEEPIVPQYNGNIAAARWKTSQVLSSQTVAPPKMGYQYRYDVLNRLTSAISEQDDIVNSAHDESIAYDISGNITTLQRKAYTGGNVETIDDLAYTYDGYRSKKIDDQSLSLHKNMGYHDQAQLPEEYIYDDNGNMIEDKNKDITLEYNDRNLIRKITFGGDPDHRLEFLYDRTGKKLQARNYRPGTPMAQVPTP